MNTYLRVFPLAVFFILSAVAFSTSFAQTTTPIEVIDGDTVAVRIDGVRTRVRMVDYDTPEVGRFAACPAERALGERAKRRLRSLINLRGVRLEYTNEVDPFGRRLAYLRIGRTSVGTVLMREGLALPYGPNGVHEWPRRLCQGG